MELDNNNRPVTPKTAVARQARNQQQLVKLNVGGVKYITSETTLTSRGINFLSVMLENDKEGKIPAVRDDDDFIFIDRNGRVFEVILDYLRTGKLIVPPTLSQQQVALELDFYQIEALYIDSKPGPLEKIIQDLKASANLFIQTNFDAITQQLCVAAEQGKAKVRLIFYQRDHLSEQFKTLKSDPKQIVSVQIDGVVVCTLEAKLNTELFYKVLCWCLTRSFGCNAQLTGVMMPNTTIDMHLTVGQVDHLQQLAEDVHSCVLPFSTYGGSFLAVRKS